MGWTMKPVSKLCGIVQILPWPRKMALLFRWSYSIKGRSSRLCATTQLGELNCVNAQIPNFKLLYDIYHMQIEEGDIIRR